MTQNGNFAIIACFLFCGLVQYSTYPHCLETFEFKGYWNIVDNNFLIAESQIFYHK